MRSEASHPGPHVACVPVLPLVTAERRNDCLSLTALARRALSLRLVAVVISRSLPSKPRSPTALPAFAGKRGRRPQRPGNQPRSHASLEVFPPAIRSRESPAATGSAAIIRQAQERSRFADSLSFRSSRRAIQKPCSIVQKLWTTAVPCGRPRKTKIEFGDGRIIQRRGSMTYGQTTKIFRSLDGSVVQKKKSSG